MKKVLITGASGNIGYEIIRSLKVIDSPFGIIAGVHDTTKAKSILKAFPGIEYRRLDFCDPSTFDSALQDTDIVFLLRPPHLADVTKYFAPFIQSMKDKNISKIVFLSVQGVETQKMIPHYKIEQLILKHHLEYAFLRPGYFMQNLTSTLVHEIKAQNRIFIPSGDLKLVWTDARDIGLVGAHVLNEFEARKKQAYEITGSEFKGFKEVAEILSEAVGRRIEYESPGLMKFFREKRKLGIARNMIFVMIMLHFLPRFGKNPPRLTETVKQITGKEPGRLIDFIFREKSKFI